MKKIQVYVTTSGGHSFGRYLGEIEPVPLH
jgi:hypothetical protein